MHPLQRAEPRLGRVGVAADRVDAQHRHDVARHRLVDVLALVGVHLHDPAEPLLAAGPLVVVRVAFDDLALVEPHERQRAVRILDDLERHRHRRLRRVGRQRNLPLLVLVAHRLRLALQRRGQVVHYRVQQRLYSLVAIGGAHEHGCELQAEHGLLRHAAYERLRNRLLGQQQFQELVAVHRQRLEHVLAVLLRLVLQFGRDLVGANLLAVGALVVNRLHRHQVDDPLEVRFLADRKLHEHRVAGQFLAQLPHHPVRIGPRAVHLVDECQPRHVVPLHLAVDGQRLRLHPPHGAEHEHRSVEHPEAPLHFHGEVDVPRRVDEVDRGVAPADRGGRAGDRDPALALQVHVVHGRPVAADLLHAVDPAGIEQDPLAQRRLAGVDMGRNTNVSQSCQVHRRQLSFPFGRWSVTRSARYATSTVLLAVDSSAPLSSGKRYLRGKPRATHAGWLIPGIPRT